MENCIFPPPGWLGLQAGLINKGNACGNVRKCETFVTTLKCLCIASIFREIIIKLQKMGKLSTTFRGKTQTFHLIFFIPKKCHSQTSLKKSTKLKSSVSTPLSDRKHIYLSWRIWHVMYIQLSLGQICVVKLYCYVKRISSKIWFFFNLRQCRFMLREGDSIRALLGRPSLPTLVIFQSGIAPC